ncbi:hypothetical protein DSCW_26070 [Desulfosarcina widdelii]|uniref:Mor transcription activator domain-containing protein n=1 Tax=Desulfosarcina widdelii TaxID=947919 RepID=A0A5K7Z3E8_9BACT|nr:Mor transcription activator family protein [Desulfosarcina widdelii]BBO75190.1 hypothetical protein DSCW_26070 [Desulfosarcina widdelii]
MECEIRMDELSPGLREIADIIGLKNLLKLVNERGGESIYIPSKKTVFRMHRDQKIRQEFSGSNHGELARKFGATTVWIRKIVQRS